MCDLLEVKSQKGKHTTLEMLLLVIIAVLPILIFITIIHLVGPQWDLTVRYLSGRTLVNFLINHNHISAQAAFVGEFSNNLLYYFEPYREPLSTPIFALLSVIFHKSVLPYIILIYLVYLFAIYELGKELKIDRLILFAVFVNSYVIYFFFVPNGGEGLSIIFVMLGLVYLLKKKPVSGLFFGLASIAKYPSIILFPLVLLLDDRKKTMQAILLELLPVLVWGGVIDYLLYGVPFFSYFESIGASGIAAGPSAISLIAVLKVIGYPAIFAAMGIIFLLINREKLKFKLKLDYNSKVLIAFTALAGICYLIILPHNDPLTQSRYGYLFAAALLTLAALLLTYVMRKPNGQMLKYVVAIAAIAMLCYALYYTYATNNIPSVAYYNPDNPNTVYSHAWNELDSMGFGDCRFVSNAWVPMIYSGYDAYSPFILYTSGVITPIVKHILNSTGLNPTNSTVNGLIAKYGPHNSTINYTAYADEEERYPIVVFRWSGVPPSFITNLNGSTLAYADQNISIYLPKNASCYKG